MNTQENFLQLIQIFLGSAMQALGKIKNPISDKIERDLNQAKHAIDMMEMLKDKTKGNLSSEEAQFLDMALSQCRMNYVDEVNKK